jgi:hypothetical protein
MLLQRSLLAVLAFCASDATVRAQTPIANSTSVDTKLTAQDRLAASTSLYKGVTTYRDDGLLIQEMNFQGQGPVRGAIGARPWGHPSILADRFCFC